ncbi:glutamyl-tRNA reductase [Kingella oralis]|jgi:glutamyl-tRNA reductase|uniref:Glutamyl-tRNA reductase n=1 Tax=Kingella oralis ATCC 51147 TaxID=629741 RepID=C4GMA8_9NEIS|nr:glutamyl-tRNA reductase [Kingella oralis]EEP66866.1 glutamyl-tRNA reductase [Kingella oralis ATCC 51147]QMT42723.1 glutamyl-tRNA reductase [Kingella oralis]
MKLTVIGLNHQTAPLAIREQLAFAAAALPEAVRDLSVNAAAEAVILSTCNRTELYCVGDAEMIINWLADYQGVNADDIRPYLYTLGCSETIRHAFRVACGLDSMVLGEAQILGQMKEAVRIAREQGSISTWLNALFQRTFQAAKEVRSLSGVGDNVVSMASAAVRMAEQSVGDIGSLNVLFVGAGEMNESVATYFAAKQPRSLMVANRTLTRAANLCSKLGNDAQACKLEALPEILHRYDIIISCTGSELPVITRDMMAHAVAQRTGSLKTSDASKTQFMLDLAVPRDIEASIAELPHIALFTVDDMAERVAHGKEARAAAAAQAEAMVQAKVNEFVAWQQSRQRVPLICALRDEGERARQQVLNHAMRQLAKGTPPEEVLERLSVQLTNKLLHSPTRALNKADSHDIHVVKALAQVYHLPH